MNLQTDATWFADLGGKHEFKAGVQYDVVKNDVLNGETGNLHPHLLGHGLWQQPCQPRRLRLLPDALQRLRSQPWLPHARQDPEQQPRPVPPGLLDHRPEADPEPRPPHGAGDGSELRCPRIRTASRSASATTSTTFDFSQKLAPRIGFAYDVKGDGKTKVYGSWGLFYDIFKLALPRGSFGGDKWIDIYYTLDTPNPADLLHLRGEHRRNDGRELPGPPDPGAGRLPAPVVRLHRVRRRRQHRPGSVPPPGVLGRHRALAHQQLVGLPALRAQAGRQGDRGHRLPGSPRATRRT